MDALEFRAQLRSESLHLPARGRAFDAADRSSSLRWMALLSRFCACFESERPHRERDDRGACIDDQLPMSEGTLGLTWPNDQRKPAVKRPMTSRQSGDDVATLKDFIHNITSEFFISDCSWEKAIAVPAKAFSALTIRFFDLFDFGAVRSAIHRILATADLLSASRNLPLFLLASGSKS
jgi:hypothetical protein